MDRRTLIRKTRIISHNDGPLVAFGLEGEIGVLSCTIHMAIINPQRVGLQTPYKGDLKVYAHVQTHRHYPRNPTEKRRTDVCEWLLDDYCYGTTWRDDPMAMRFIQGDIEGIWRALELGYENWWRNVKSDSETEDFYLEGTD